MDKLNELMSQKENIEVQITSEKIRIAKKEGLIVGSIEEIICKEHPKSNIVINGEISDSDYRINGKSPNYYSCESCQKDYGYGLKIAYDCPICEGIVMGQIKEIPYDDLGPLCGSSGIKYCCINCDTELGRWVIIRS